MSIAIAPLPIRLFGDLFDPLASAQADLITGASPFFYRGDDIEIDLGVGAGGNLFTPLTGSGAGGIASFTAQLFATENDTNPAMMSATVTPGAPNLALTQAQWSDNTSPFYHAAFVFSNAQTSISLNGQKTQSYWLRITALTADTPAKTITFVDGPIEVRDGPITTLVAPAVGGSTAIITIAGTQYLGVLNQTDGLYYGLLAQTVGGVPTLGLTDTGSTAGALNLGLPTPYKFVVIGGAQLLGIRNQTDNLFYGLVAQTVAGVPVLGLSDTGSS